MVFHERLKWVRQQTGRLQKDVAEYLGMAPNAYQRYELGTREPSLDKLGALSAYFDVPSDYFLGRGIFKSFHVLLEHRERLSISLLRFIPAAEALEIETWTDLELLRFLDAVFRDITVADNQFFFEPRLPIEDLKSLTFSPPEK